jgi:methylamine--corrinoid protein Co-methyltransferase
MKNRARLTDVLARAEDGPLVDERDFERKLLSPALKKVIEKYRISFDESNIVPNNHDLADRLFQAGLEVAVEVGLYCQNTARRILWTQDELEEGFRYAQPEIVMGSGADSVVVRLRRPGEASAPIVSGGAYGVPVPEHLYIPLSLSYLKEPIIDVIDNGSLETVYGHPVKAGSPWEVLAAHREAELAIQAAKIAGRPGISLGCVELSPTALGALAGASWGAYRPADWHHVSTLSEFKTNYDMLSIVAHVTRIGAGLEAYYNPIYGGYVGGAEGVAAAIVGGLILLNQIDMGHVFSTRPNHPFYNCNTTPELLWAMSIAVQALTRNTNLLIATLAGPAGGPGTKTLLYENAAHAIATTVSGQAVIETSHSAAGGRTRNHASGLDAKMSGEVSHAVRGVSLEQANELVQRLLKLYEMDLSTNPIGKAFDEVYDIENIEPTPEWQGIYDEVKEELIQMGIPMDKVFL